MTTRSQALYAQGVFDSYGALGGDATLHEQ